MKKMAKNAILKLSERPWSRSLIGWVASIYGYRIIPGYRVYWDNGVWVHRYRGSRYTAHEQIEFPKRVACGAANPDFIVHNYVHAEPASHREIIQDLCRYLPRPGDTVVDVGAGKGTFTAALAHFVGPKGRVLAIEAHPGQFQCLQALCSLNALDNVSPIQCAVSDHDSELVIQDGIKPDANVVSASGPGFRVQATTLDKILAAHGIDFVDLLTMNIEGAERYAILGLTRSISKIRRVAIACHDFRAEEEGDETMRTMREVHDFLELHGFDIAERARTRYGAAANDWVAAGNIEQID